MPVLLPKREGYFLKNIIKMFEKDSIEILKADSSHSFPLHSHECFCLGVVDRGRVCFTIGKQERILTVGMCFLIPSNVGVMIEPVERYGYTTICFKNEIKEYLMGYDYDDYFPRLCTKTDGNCLELLSSLCDSYTAGDTRQIFMDGILSLLKDFMKEKKISGTTDDIVEKGKAYIRACVDEKFNLDELADYVHVSKYHFIRIFKERTGVTPNQYYIQAEIFAAKQALKENKKEVDVAANLNFTDQSYLCRVFKRQMGISMRDFKSNYQKAK